VPRLAALGVIPVPQGRFISEIGDGMLDALGPRARGLVLPPAVGSLAPGKLADLAVLSADPTAVDPASLATIDVLATVVDGRVVHDAMGLG
jgi:predicted amidohydrolase YtcJ